MTTPIYDFVQQYADQSLIRLHMPGHKGTGYMGCEAFDITEIKGADSLYEANGIIAESEANATQLFGCPTYYSTEGSSHCIRAMMYLVCKKAVSCGRRPLIAAGRNVHKTFLSAAALLDFDIDWLYFENDASYLSCLLEASDIEAYLNNVTVKPDCVYITTPDYLGNTVDVEAIAKVCKRNDVLLAVDCAHGAYLHFAPNGKHPMDCGADICCSSAHKTLPVLTGGAYLHTATGVFEGVKEALALFGSTSPSYLTLASLDKANEYMATGYSEALAVFEAEIIKLKNNLVNKGYTLYGNEPMKLAIATKPYGYKGCEIADILYKKGIVCEFCDPDYIVFMFTPEVGIDAFKILGDALFSIEKRNAITELPVTLCKGERVLSVREAMLCESESLPVTEALGRILASPSVGCPPAVPILVCGERIDNKAIEAFKYYGIEQVVVRR